MIKLEYKGRCLHVEIDGRVTNLFNFKGLGPEIDPPPWLNAQLFNRKDAIEILSIRFDDQ